MQQKCKHTDKDGNELVIKPDGINELDPCIYKDEKMYTNVNVVVAHCTICGHTSVTWTRNEDTEELCLTGGE